MTTARAKAYLTWDRDKLVARIAELEGAEAMNKFKAYCRNWYLFIAGFRWLWTHEIKEGPGPQRPRKYPWCILYKPGWTPLKFLPVYCSTYLLGTLFGCGVVSLSQFWYERGMKIRLANGKVITPIDEPWLFFSTERWAHPISRWLTRALDWLLPGARHGALTGPRLWRSINLWERS